MYPNDGEKLGRIAKKYGVSDVSKLESLVTSKRAIESNSMEKIHGISMQKPSETPLELDKLTNLLTTQPPAPPMEPLAKLPLKAEKKADEKEAEK